MKKTWLICLVLASFVCGCQSKKESNAVLFEKFLDKNVRHSPRSWQKAESIQYRPKSIADVCLPSCMALTLHSSNFLTIVSIA